MLLMAVRLGRQSGERKAGTGNTGDSTVPARLTEAKGRMVLRSKEGSLAFQ